MARLDRGHVDCLKYLDSDLESGLKSQENIYFRRNDRFFCNDTPNGTSSCESWLNTATLQSDPVQANHTPSVVTFENLNTIVTVNN